MGAQQVSVSQEALPFFSESFLILIHEESVGLVQFNTAEHCASSFLQAVVLTR